ncbi:MAG: GDP-mannose 4,6-dehydratase, partial [Thermoprotei archaeon]
MARVVVTGGLGFIGSRVVRELASDYEVVVVDDCSRAKVEVGDMECSVMRVSVLDYEALLDALTGAEA